MGDTPPFPAGRHQAVLAQLGDHEPQSRIEAYAVLEAIRAGKGYLDQGVLQDLKLLKPENREYLLRLVEQKKETEAAYTTRFDAQYISCSRIDILSISEQLYSSKYRFLYEVIQNADDSHYHKAKAASAQPFMRFIITPETFVIETNEDGFTRKNVEAICATGKSSKKGSSSKEYTGEKGFGFKSVFSIANEVRIQSGLWSFRFEHHQGDDGLGMVTPLDATTEDLPPDVTTRFTLRLTPNARREYNKLLEAICDLPDTTCFFLRKLSTLWANLTRPDGSKEVHSIKKTMLQGGQQAQIDRTVAKCGAETSVSNYYYLVEHEIENMPDDDRRKDQNRAAVTLAFPVDPVNQKPRTSDLGQHVFAYLPLQRLPHLQFLIQSDFIASASRESVIDCAWNDFLCNGVVQAFTKAVQVFATEDHALRHAWLFFLPHKPMEKPWSTMYSSIIESVKTLPAFQTWQQRRYKKPTELRWLPSAYLHKGQPILADQPNEMYLASEYNRFANERIRKDLGIRTLSWDDILLIIRTDLAKLFPRIRMESLDGPWFESFARLCTTLLRSQNANSAKTLLKKQPLIPLTSNYQWTGAPGMGYGGLSAIYFACTDSIPVPNDIGLNLLRQAASANATVKRFYTALGVQDCPKDVVFANIQKTHRSRRADCDLRSHLRYLFHNHENPSELKPWLFVPTDIGPRTSDCRFYFSSDAPYDMENLLSRHTRLQNELNYGVIPADILDLEPATALIKGRTWKKWLQEATGALHYPSLTRKTVAGNLLSFELSYVLKLDPEKFLGALKAHWAEYQYEASRSNDTLMTCEVLCMCNQRIPLNETYLPTKHLLERLRELSIPSESIPILCIPDGDGDETLHHEWRFLEDFGVRFKPDLQFYKTALTVLSAANGTTAQQTHSVYRSMAQLATIDDHQDLCTFFNKHRRILCAGDWVLPIECVWRGPEFFVYTMVLEASYPEDNYIESFFTTILGIDNADIYMVLDELSTWADDESDEFRLADTQKVYEYLSSHAVTDEELNAIRSAFTKQAIVLGTDSTWHTLQTCYWSSPSPLAGHVDLQRAYPDLKDFFVRKMRVKKASPAMLIKEVKKMAECRNPDATVIRDRLIEIGTILAKDGFNPDASVALQELLEVKFLPRRSADGTLALVDVQDDFAVLDHVRYGNALADEGILLDFDIHETHLLHVMIQELGITSRYLSTAVSEISDAGDERLHHLTLTRALQARAYALYCCAAKHRSRKALREDRALYDLLVQLEIYTTDTITTDLVLDLGNSSLRVRSDKPLIHHTISDGILEIYIPQDVLDRRACRRSQLPRLLSDIIGNGSVALYDISSIISCDIAELDDILVERDITNVSWITRPILDIESLRADEGLIDTEDRAEIIISDAVPSVTAVERSSDLLVSASLQSMSTSVPVRANNDHATHDRDYATLEAQATLAQQSQYRELLERLIAISQGAYHDITHTFDARLTFGGQSTNDFIFNRRIGAAGEAFVFEQLRALNLPGFTIDNWQSTIRGEVSVHSRYADLSDWRGTETSDLVYKDNTGHLTQFFRGCCTGGFPSQIPMNHDHASNPIEYYLEVKSTPGQNSTRFFMSSGQYNRMEDMAQQLGQGRMQVYVIVRVSRLIAANVSLEIFIDPLRFKGSLLRFETEQWFVNIQ